MLNPNLAIKVPIKKDISFINSNNKIKGKANIENGISNIVNNNLPISLYIDIIPPLKPFLNLP